MIKIGLTGWGDHPSIYRTNSTRRDKLFDYSSHFPIVELDTSFYAIPSLQNIEKWVNETPDSFRFIVKTYQGMTGHLRDDNPYETRSEMFDAFRQCARAFQNANKLAMILVQFPPWFDCSVKNVNYIRYVKQQLEDFPIAIEFRNRTWYSEERKHETIQFLRDLGFIHTVCDEPQAGVGSVPFVAEATHDKSLVRIHGRNVYGWRNSGSTENWREVRFLYDYNKEELTDMANKIRNLEQLCKEVYVLFNNNSGHHAADNAKALQRMLDLDFDGLSPKQLDFFEGEF
ncbi:DUF72 domain-containing protein [Lysinibacillus sp. SGAir0095]|uniref:DUF72 domain-containing protein n=1 Tax=Lysinibacillus sp. SGAir0095 TaxID=2070463 RepID=UPI0010CCBBF0|nr:DUF72 domain-containing protein [Lysinibacillus sp. SGAir0095]QCR33379.1 DUF72 domain-containing protein [Lysinibacillus sp. SGAir0095]